MNQLVYLHGHRSSPTSIKAVEFSDRCRQEGWDLQVPDLNGPSRDAVLITDQRTLLDNAISRPPSVVIGSSLGAYLAALYASENTEVKGLVLLAPSLKLFETLGNIPPADRLGLGVTERFMADLSLYPVEPVFSQPALIFHGRGDTQVSFINSRRYADQRPNRRFVELDSDHRLEEPETLDIIWKETRNFIIDHLQPKGILPP